MEKMTVWRAIKIRHRNIWREDRGWSDWSDWLGSYEDAIEYVKGVTTQDASILMQVAFFFYDDQEKEIAWNSGSVYQCGRVQD